MILSTKQEFVDCLAMNEDSQYIGRYQNMTLRSVYQPIFDGASKIIGVEALVRIQDAFAGTIRPDLFFHSSDIDFDDRVNVDRLSRVIHIRNFARSEYRNLKLFLNVLPLAGQYLALENVDSSLLSKRLRDLGIDNSQIVMEVVELNASSDAQLALAMHKLAECNFNIAVDDFGVNASNHQRVMRLKPDIIKIDRSLLLSYMDGNQSQLLSAIHLAKEIQAKTVVEGIETQEQFDAMKKLNIDLFQGYFLALPAPLPVVHDDKSNDFNSLGDPSVVYRPSNL